MKKLSDYTSSWTQGHCIDTTRWKINLINLMPKSGIYTAERVRQALLFIEDELERG